MQQISMGGRYESDVRVTEFEKKNTKGRLFAVHESSHSDSAELRYMTSLWIWHSAACVSGDNSESASVKLASS